MDPPGLPARHRSIAIAAAAEAWRRWRAASRALPAGTWRRYWAISGPALALLVAGAVGLARLGASADEAWLDAWDERALRGFIEHGPLDFVAGVLLESGGNSLYLLPLTTIAALVAAWRGRALTAVGLLNAYWLSRLIVLAGWSTWDRSRPDLVAAGIAAPGAHSFPSGHAALAAASYGYLAWLWLDRARSPLERVAAVLLTTSFVVTIAAGRLRIGSHWPSDVIAGIVLGALWAAALAYAEARARRA